VTLQTPALLRPDPIFSGILEFGLYRMLGTLVSSPTIDLGGGSKSRVARRPSQPAPPLQDTPLGPITRTAVSLEYAGLRNRDHCPLGMYVVPSSDNLLIWDCVFFVHQGTSGVHVLLVA
jgi:hypothetical protein